MCLWCSSCCTVWPLRYLPAKETHRGMQMPNCYSLQDKAALLQSDGSSSLVELTRREPLSGPRSPECLPFSGHTLASVRDTAFQLPINPVNEFVKLWQEEQQFSHPAGGSACCERPSVTRGALLYSFLMVCFTVPLTINWPGIGVSQCSLQLCYID